MPQVYMGLAITYYNPFAVLYWQKFQVPFRQSQHSNTCIQIRMFSYSQLLGKKWNQISWASPNPVMACYLYEGKLLPEQMLVNLIIGITSQWILFESQIIGMILGLRPANERRCYFVTTSLTGWAQT